MQVSAKQFDSPFEYVEASDSLRIDLTVKGEYLHLDEEGNITWKSYSDLTFLEKVGQKWARYWRRPHRGLVNSIRALYQRHQQVIDELHARPLSSDHPLQDLGVRLRRVQVLACKRDALQYVVIKYWQRDQISFEWDFTVKNGTLLHLSKSKPAVFCSLNISHNGATIPIEVRAKFDDSLADRNQIWFTIHRLDLDEEVALFSVKRMVDNGKTILYCNQLSDEKLGPEQNGDRPVVRLIIQLLVELFSLEKETELHALARMWHSDIFNAAGFDSESTLVKFSADLNNSLTSIRAIARRAGLVFPHREEESQLRANCCLRKVEGWTDSELQSKFVHLEASAQGKVIKPALVDFHKDRAPVTWEQYIQQTRLLPQTGPILPHYVENR